MMNRENYRKARAMIRGNGRVALKWMPHEHAEQMRRIVLARPDPLAFRVWIVGAFGPASPMLRAEMQARNT
jgi:hypothetical protein